MRVRHWVAAGCILTPVYVSIALITYWLWFDTTSPDVPYEGRDRLEGDLVNAKEVYYPGDVVEIKWYGDKRRNCFSMFQRVMENTVTYDMGSHSGLFKSSFGPYKRTTTLTVPHIPPGTYNYNVYAEFQCNPIRALSVAYYGPSIVVGERKN